MAMKPDKVFINNKQYIETEDWQLLGKFYGLTAKIVSTSPLNFGTVRGWEARAAVVDRAGVEISAADAMCLNDEERWSTRAKYEWLYVLNDGTKTRENPPKKKIVWVENPKFPGKKFPKREKVKVADEAVPFFQLRSMAQTRAVSKALRNVLAWVVVLAGYNPTPPEEHYAAGEEEEEKTPDPGAGEKEKAAPWEKEKTAPITEEQKARIFQELKKRGFEVDVLIQAMGKPIAFFDDYADVNAALEWIRKQKA
jgi:hypothetical protein